MDLKSKQLFFIDLDGTVYLGDRIIPGAKEFIEKLRQKRIAYYFLSNNSSRSKKDYVKKLNSMRISAEEKNIILSTDGVITFLEKAGVKDIYLVGTKSMKEQFAAHGFSFEEDEAKYVVLGYDTELTYEKIKTAALLLLKGIPFISTHPDLVCPSPQGPLPDAGSIIEMFKTSTGVQPKVFGKPNKEMIEHVIQESGLKRSAIALIGDRLYTDKKLAENCGIDFICVLSGETKQKDLDKIEPQPSLVVKSVAELTGRF